MKNSLLNLNVMKRVIPFVVIAAVILAACNTNTRTRAEVASSADTTGLAEFRLWKQQQEFLNQMAAYQMATGNVAAVKQPAYTQSSSARRSTSSRSVSNSDRTVYSSESSNAAKKKGWSKAAKGAVIGGVAGGVAGAVIHKRNRAVGGVVGAVLGAGGGYAIGRGMDKRDGRY
ncbi:MAG TPA: glycine zipper 2TM domain-containing protein [Flavisolibacter sp.]